MQCCYRWSCQQRAKQIIKKTSPGINSTENCIQSDYSFLLYFQTHEFISIDVQKHYFKKIIFEVTQIRIEEYISQDRCLYTIFVRITWHKF